MVSYITMYTHIRGPTHKERIRERPLVTDPQQNMDDTRGEPPVPKPRVRSNVKSSPLFDDASDLPAPLRISVKTDLVSRPREDTEIAGEPVDTEHGHSDSNLSHMYTDENLEDSDEEYHDSYTYEGTQRRVLPDPLSGIDTQCMPDDQSISTLGPTYSFLSSSPKEPRSQRSSSTSSEDTRLLLREVADLKNKNISLKKELEIVEQNIFKKRQELGKIVKDTSSLRENLEERERRVGLREKSLVDKEQILLIKEGNIEMKLKKLQQRERDLEEQEDRFILKKKAIDEREYLLSEQESDYKGTQGGAKEEELKQKEKEIKSREDKLQKWSMELHEEAEHLRRKDIDLDLQFKDKMAALSLFQEESRQGGGDEMVFSTHKKTVESDSAMKAKLQKEKEDMEMAKKLQDELWVRLLRKLCFKSILLCFISFITIFF